VPLQYDSLPCVPLRHVSSVRAAVDIFLEDMRESASDGASVRDAARDAAREAAREASKLDEARNLNEVRKSAKKEAYLASRRPDDAAGQEDSNRNAAREGSKRWALVLVTDASGAPPQHKSPSPTPYTLRPTPFTLHSTPYPLPPTQRFGFLVVCRVAGSLFEVTKVRNALFVVGVDKAQDL
jgi:hypothetical protein